MSAPGLRNWQLDVPTRARAPMPDVSNLYLFSIDYEDVRGELVGGWSNADRLPDTTARYLTFLQAHDVTATFFVSGETARAHPELIADVISAGHEIGCHGWRHVPMERYQPAQFKDDISKSLECLYKAGAKRVVGFRAPYLSFTEQCAWAYEVLADLKFVYSSSVLPGRNPLYGWSGFGDTIRPVAGVYELPVSVISFAGVSLPFASGACFRTVPWFLLRAIFDRRRKGSRPLIGYFHPQDIDTEQGNIRYAEYGHVGNMVLRCNRRQVLERIGAIFTDGWRAMPYIEFVERHLCTSDR
jgi:polysaccharide deacetylase family protein (PEP-CTERM system associated)